MFKVFPIDIDFAGWCCVEAGEHNAWGVVNTINETLSAYYPVKVAADNKAVELNKEAVS